VGGLLAEGLRGRLYVAGILLIGLALAGVVSSRAITPVSPANPQARFRLNFVSDMFPNYLHSRQDRVLWLACGGQRLFWFLGLLMQTNILFFGKERLGSTRGQHRLPAGGSCGRHRFGQLRCWNCLGPQNRVRAHSPRIHRHFHLLFTLALPGWTFWKAAGLLAALGFSAGFFIVPLNALLQHRPAPEVKGSVIAMANLMTFVGMLVATGFTGCCPLSCI
jgi:hypothetical protein